MPAVDFPNPRAAALSAYRNGTARGGVMAKPAMAAPGAPAGQDAADAAAAASQGGAGGAYAGALGGMQPGGGPTVGSLGSMGLGSGSQTPRDALAGFRTRNPRSGATIGTMRATGAQRPKVPGIMRPNRMDYR